MVRYIHYIITNNYLDYKYEDKFPNDKICTTVEDWNRLVAKAVSSQFLGGFKKRLNRVSLFQWFSCTLQRSGPDDPCSYFHFYDSRISKKLKVACAKTKWQFLT